MGKGVSPGQVQADFRVGVFIDVRVQHVEPLDFHQEVTGLVLGVMGHVIRDDLFDQLQQDFLLSFISFLDLLPFFSDLSCQMPADTHKITSQTAQNDPRLHLN